MTAPGAVAPRRPRRRPSTLRSPRWAVAALGGVIAVGATVRTWEWWQARSLSLDELWLADSIVFRGFMGLLEPLDHCQTAPVGWLLAERLAVDLFGGSERVLRLSPLLFGIAALPVVAMLIRRVIGPWPAVLATALAALSPSLIRYSEEMRPYSSDVFWAASVILLAVTAVRHATRRSLLAWAVASVIAVWFSTPAFLVVAGTGVGLLAGNIRERALFRRAVAGSVLGTGLAVVPAGLFLLSTTQCREGLQWFWTVRVMGLPPSSRPGDVLPWTSQNAQELLGVLLRPPSLWFAAALCLAGIVALAVRGLAAVVLAPVAVAYAAAVAGQYPMSGRVALYLFAPVVTAYVGGIVLAFDALNRAIRRRSVPALRAILALVLGVLCLWPTLLDFSFRPVPGEGPRGGYETVARLRQPTEPVLLLWGANVGQRYYGPATGLDRARVVALTTELPPCQHFMNTWTAGDTFWLLTQIRPLRPAPGNPELEAYAALEGWAERLAADTVQGYRLTRWQVLPDRVTAAPCLARTSLDFEPFTNPPNSPPSVRLRNPFGHGA